MHGPVTQLKDKLRQKLLQAKASVFLSRRQEKKKKISFQNEKPWDLANSDTLYFVNTFKEKEIKRYVKDPFLQSLAYSRCSLNLC